MRIRALICGVIALGAFGSWVGASGAFHSRGGAAPNSATVRLGEYFYKPRVVTVHVGQRVRFLNVGKIAHTVADTDRHGNIRSKLIHPRELKHGQSQIVRFAKTGTVYYVCTFHPALMKGRIVVVR